MKNIGLKLAHFIGILIDLLVYIISIYAVGLVLGELLVRGHQGVQELLLLTALMILLACCEKVYDRRFLKPRVPEKEIKDKEVSNVHSDEEFYSQRS